VRKKNDNSLQTQYKAFKESICVKLDAKMYGFVREHFSPVEQLTRLSNNAITQI
jgi:hypothetical protein